MDSETLVNELNRVQKRDKRHLKILISGYLLLTIFGFLTIAILLDSLKSKYESKFDDFDRKTNMITKDLTSQLDRQRKAFDDVIKVRDEVFYELEKDVKDNSYKSREEIDKLWLTAYVKSTNNRKDIIVITDQVSDIANKMKDLKLSIEHIKSKIEVSNAEKINAEVHEGKLNELVEITEQLAIQFKDFENRIDKNQIQSKTD